MQVLSGQEYMKLRMNYARLLNRRCEMIKA